MPLTYLAPSWDQIYEMLIELSGRVKRSGFTPDVIVGVSRGGWTPARVASDLLDNPNTASIKIEFYVGPGDTAKKPVVTQPVSFPVKGKNVLLVDDVADTGESMRVAIDHLNQGGAERIKTATIYYKPHSSYKPDFYVGETSAWIIFPWERLETTRHLLEEAKRVGKTLDWVRRTLAESGLDRKTVDKLIEFVRGEP